MNRRKSTACRDPFQKWFQRLVFIFRLTQTLHFNSSIEAILGMGLFLAEVYIWVMLLLNYLQTVWP
ncbi:hypothetical protein INR21_29745, partial [Klebsiella pneumoniae]|nr:hypothetical protein [Klebsiella pneumoniae]